MNPFNHLKIKSLSKAFKEETIQYVKQVNEFRAEGMKSQWKEPLTIAPPQDTREKYADAIYKIVLQFNQQGNIDELRALFPPQSEIFCALIDKKNTLSILNKVIAINSDQFLLLSYIPQFSNQGDLDYVEVRCHIHKDNHFFLLETIKNFGVCPQKKIFAYINLNEIILTKMGADNSLRTIDLSKKAPIYLSDHSLWENDCDLSEIEWMHCIPFSDGNRVLLASEDFGVLLIENEKYTLIFPEKQDFIEFKKKQQQESSTHPNALDGNSLSMLHIALSHNNQLIALGYQASEHLLYRADGVLLGKVTPLESYPHYAVFSKDDSQLAFNSCHFYNGSTLAILIKDRMLNSAATEDKMIVLDRESRVYAAVSTSYGYIIGDSSGYIRARTHEGEYLWDDYLGFNITTMDLTSDEQFLYVGTDKGTLYKIHLNYGEKSPYQIGNSNNREVKRWLFWEKDTILIW